MAKPVTAQEIPDTAAFMQDLWKMIKLYYKVENTDAYWKSFMKTCDDLNAKYNKNRLHQLLMLSMTQWIAEQLNPEEYRKYKADRIAEDFIKMNIETE